MDAGCNVVSSIVNKIRMVDQPRAVTGQNQHCSEHCLKNCQFIFPKLL